MLLDSYSEAEIWKALESVHMKHAVETLATKLDSPVTEGTPPVYFRPPRPLFSVNLVIWSECVVWRCVALRAVAAGYIMFVISLRLLSNIDDNPT